MEFRGFLNELPEWDTLHKDSSSKSKSRARKAAKSTTGKMDKDKGPISKFPTENIKKTNSRQYSDVFDPISSTFLNEEKLPDATSEKELGNEYFKQKKFLEAIDCYSRSIAFSPTSVTFANRAMCYLKLRKFEEAENDCTDALNLDDHYVKAYSRRVTARKELDKLEEAMEDADFAVRLDPNNPELRKQYSEIKAMLEKKSSNAASKESQAKGIYSVTTKAQTSEASNVQRMNGKGRTSGKPLVFPVPIDKRTTSSMIESMDDSHTLDGSGESVASKLNNSIATEPYGGNHKHELRATLQELASRAASRVTAAASKNITTPTTAYQFEVSWRSLSNDPAKQSQILKTIPPPDLPKIFKNALSAPILIDIVRSIATFFRDDTVLAVSMLDSLTKVPRFDMIIMCLSGMDRVELRRLWEAVFSNHQMHVELNEILGRLRPKYCYGEWESHTLGSDGEMHMLM